VFAYPILLYWMNPAFARNGALVLAVMALSQFVDSLTNLPSLVNDGMGHPRVSGMFALARALLGLAVVYAGVALWGIDGAAWGHLAASVVLTVAFLLAVHGRTVPTRMADLVNHAYLPSVFGVGLVALAATLCRPLAAHSPLDMALLVLLTGALLAAFGAMFVVEKDDKNLAWSKVKGLLSVR
jgi:O-antigen/teichoic acid export membrane protein